MGVWYGNMRISVKILMEEAIRSAGLLVPRLLETGRKLGEGSYGEVVEVKVEGKLYAGKRLHAFFYRRDVPPAEVDAISKRFEQECLRLPHLKHPNILQVVGVHFDPSTRQPTLVMELLHASLSKHLETHPATPPHVKHSILLGVARGLEYLHTLPPPLGPIVHRYLTANNIVLTSNITAKIADLGQARIIDRNPAQLARRNPWTMCPGNLAHMPPEALLDAPTYDAALDVFSFGVVMLHTLTQEWPEPSSYQVPGPGGYRLVKEVERRRRYLDKIDNPLLKPLVTQCLHDNAELRPSTGDLVGALDMLVRLQQTVQQNAQEIKVLQERLSRERNEKIHFQQELEQKQQQYLQLSREISQRTRDSKYSEESKRKAEREDRGEERRRREAEMEERRRKETGREDVHDTVATPPLHYHGTSERAEPHPQDSYQGYSLAPQPSTSSVATPPLPSKLQVHPKVADQQQYVTGHSVCPLSQTHAQQWQVDPYLQRARLPQGGDHNFHYPGHVLPPPAHAPIHDPPPDATLYQNVEYQSAGSEFTEASDVLQPPSNSEGNLESISVTQELRKLYQQYFDPTGLPLQQQDMEQPTSDGLDLYGDDSNPVPVDTQPAQYSFDPSDLPAPMVHFSTSTSAPSSTPASEFYTGITSSLVHSRSSGDGRFSPVEEQPQGLGDMVNDPEYQQQLQQQQLSDTEYQQQLPHNYSRGRSTSTDSKESSIDIYGSPQGEVFRRHLSRNRSSSTDCKESSIDIYTSGRGDKLGKYVLDPLHEEPAHLPSDPAPTHPSPLAHGTAHPLETNTQHPMDRPALQVQDHPDDTACPIVADREVSKRSIPLPRAALKQQLKSHSVDEVEPDSEGRRMKHRGMRTSASGSDLLQHECHSQSSEPSSPRRLDKPTPRPSRSRSPSPLSSAENSPSTSPSSPRRLDKPTPRPRRSRSPSPLSSAENSPSTSPTPARRKVSLPLKAQSVDTMVERLLSRKEWICSYCTNLVYEPQNTCDVCGREKLETVM